MPRVFTEDICLFYELHGNGHPLMLIAGLASDSQSWQPIREDLARNHLVITPDNRGAGRTTPSDVDIRIQKISDDCIALLRNLGISSAHLLGHSMGGFVALDCAIRYPERVSKLILAGTSAFNSARNNLLFLDWSSALESGMDLNPWFRNIFYWIFSRRFFENPQAVSDAVRFAVDYPYPQGQGAFRNQVKAIAEFDCSKRLAEIAAPTLIIQGREDLLFPPEESAKILQAIPNAHTCLIENAAHAIHLENPEAFTKCVLDFLNHGEPLVQSDPRPGKNPSSMPLR